MWPLRHSCVPLLASVALVVHAACKSQTDLPEREAALAIDCACLPEAPMMSMVISMVSAGAAAACWAACAMPST
eukprot:1416932-Prorocentrum_lima.AAC.1